MLGDKIDVPKDRQFLGFDAYRKAIDCLRPGDVALLTTHAGFRAVHLAYAVEKGVNVFMEKDFAADPGGIKQILRAGEAAEKKNLKIAAGLMARHSTARQAMIQQIRDGAMGDVQLIRAYRMDSGYSMGPFPQGQNELMWQLYPGHPYQFLWSSGGVFIELMIHQIDECFWIKDAWPVSAHGVGGRRADSTDCSQNLDSYSIEYTFADGTKALVTGRYIPNCFNDFVTYVHGTKCAAQFSGNIHAPTSQIYKDQRIDSEERGLETGEGGGQSVAGRVAGVAGCDSQRSAAQRSPPCSTFQPGSHHGPSGCPHRADRHLGRGDGLELSVLSECGRIDRRQSGAGPGGREWSLPGTRSRNAGRKSNAVCVEAEPMQELIDFVIQAARDGARAE